MRSFGRRPVILLIFMAFLVQQCKVAVRINTDIKGVKTYINGKYAGETPVAVRLSRNILHNYRLVFKEDEQTVLSTDIQRDFSWFALVLAPVTAYLSILYLSPPKSEQFFSLKKAKEELATEEAVRAAFSRAPAPPYQDRIQLKDGRKHEECYIVLVGRLVYVKAKDDRYLTYPLSQVDSIDLRR